VEQITGAPQDVLVYRVNPLIAYELRQHRFLVSPEDVAASAGEWLIADPKMKPILERATHSELAA
jgi:hypothetical protein